MQNLYPMFERNRILKKELLWSLRDYTFSHIQLEYQEYGQGIIRGCELNVHDNELKIGPGIIKCSEFICLMTKEEHITFAPANQMQFLKICIQTDRSSPDYIAYRIKLYLDIEETRKDNEFELCRFNLRNGARLRADYTSFADLDTEYDTLNLIHSSWGGLGGKTLAPKITGMFSEAILASKNICPEDRSFAYLCLSRPEAVPAAILNDYVCSKSNEEEPLPEGNPVLYEKLRDIFIKAGQGGTGRIKKMKERHRILVD